MKDVKRGQVKILNMEIIKQNMIGILMFYKHFMNLTFLNEHICKGNQICKAKLLEIKIIKFKLLSFKTY